MPLFLSKGDLTVFPADAIVNAANNSLLGGGGVDGAIHAAAGPELLEECRKIGGCETGKAVLTAGYRMPCRYIIHTVGPIWTGGTNGEAEILASCYTESLRLASENGCETVAFPLISSGAYGYPRAQAWKVAREAISIFLQTHDLTVTMVVPQRTGLMTNPEDEEALRSLLAEPEMLCAKEAEERKPKLFSRKTRRNPPGMLSSCSDEPVGLGFMASASEMRAGAGSVNAEKLFILDESFQEMLLRKITESGRTDADVYTAANIDRRHFSKIRCDRLYRPTKQTAVAFAIALKLSRAETDELLRKAGMLLSDSLLFDKIVTYYMAKGNYDLDEINEALFSYDQPLLGQRTD